MSENEAVAQPEPPDPGRQRDADGDRRRRPRRSRTAASPSSRTSASSLGDDDALVVDTAMGPRNGAVGARASPSELARRPAAAPDDHPLPPRARLRRAGVRPRRDDRLQPGPARGARAEGRSRTSRCSATFGPRVAEQLEGVELVEPHVVYDGEADLDLGGTVGPAAHLGARAHARRPGRLPARGACPLRGRPRREPLLPDLPLLPARRRRRRRRAAGSPSSSELEALEPDVVVPGHGEVGDAGLITTAREYLIALRTETQRLAAGGQSADEIVEALEPEFSGLHPDWVSAGVDRLRRPQLPCGAGRRASARAVARRRIDILSNDASCIRATTNGDSVRRSSDRPARVATMHPMSQRRQGDQTHPHRNRRSADRSRPSRDATALLAATTRSAAIPPGYTGVEATLPTAYKTPAKQGGHRRARSASRTRSPPTRPCSYWQKSVIAQAQGLRLQGDRARRPARAPTSRSATCSSCSLRT